jgi:hypothetical protein
VVAVVAVLAVVGGTSGKAWVVLAAAVVVCPSVFTGKVAFVAVVIAVLACRVDALSDIFCLANMRA